MNGKTKNVKTPVYLCVRVGVCVKPSPSTSSLKPTIQPPDYKSPPPGVKTPFTAR